MAIQNVSETRMELKSPFPPGPGGETLAQLFCSHGQQLYKTAYRVLRSREDAEDAVQDGLLSAVKNLNAFEGRALVSTWLTRIVINAALMRLRRRRRDRLASIEQEQRAAGEPPLTSRLRDDRPTPYEAFAQQEQLRILERKAARLPKGVRPAFWLHYIRGMSIAETAKELKVTENAVKSRLYRGRTKLLEDTGNPP